MGVPSLVISIEMVPCNADNDYRLFFACKLEDGFVRKTCNDNIISTISFMYVMYVNCKL